MKLSLYLWTATVKKYVGVDGKFRELTLALDERARYPSTLPALTLVPNGQEVGRAQVPVRVCFLTEINLMLCYVLIRYNIISWKGFSEYRCPRTERTTIRNSKLLKLTNSLTVVMMIMRGPWDPTSRSVSQERPRFSWTSKVRYSVHKRPPMDIVTI
jgi:hypothetical protein